MVRGRYAPSPTGRLHLGNLRTALTAWLQTRLSDGIFVLRMDDLDQPRNKPGSKESVVADLRWLGLDWDEGPDVGGPFAPYLQSERQEVYSSAFSDLRSRGVVYPCYCSRKDIAQALSAPHPGESLISYPGTCRPAPLDREKQTIEAEHSREHAWRFLVDDTEVHFVDAVLGYQAQRLKTEVGDFVIRRRDGLYAYQLASVVDDIDMGITDVVRGADLMDSTPRQITLYNTLGGDVPRFWHVPLMMDIEGNRMSKRDGADSLEQWQDRSPSVLVGMLAHSLGLIDEDQPVSCAELLEQLDEETFSENLRRAAKDFPLR